MNEYDLDAVPTFEPEPTIPADTPPFGVYMDVNISHVTQEDNGVLIQASRGDVEGDIRLGVTDDGDSCYYITLYTNHLTDPVSIAEWYTALRTAGFSRDFIFILKLAMKYNFKKIELAMEGANVPGLPHFDW